jgi:hypothetical protein
MVRVSGCILFFHSFPGAFFLRLLCIARKSKISTQTQKHWGKRPRERNLHSRSLSIAKPYTQELCNSTPCGVPKRPQLGSNQGKENASRGATGIKSGKTFGDPKWTKNLKMRQSGNTIDRAGKLAVNIQPAEESHDSS